MKDIFRDYVGEPQENSEFIKKKIEQLARSYKNVFTSADGIMVLKDLIEKGMIFSSTFRPESTKMQDYLEGRRSIILYILSQTEMDDMDKIKTMKE